MSTIAVIGSGTWGCAVAAMLQRAGEDVVLWGRRASLVQELQASGYHPRLPHHPLPRDLAISDDDQVCAQARYWIWAVPTQHSRAIAMRLSAHLPSDAGIVSLSKGLEQGSLLRVSQILQNTLPPHHFACCSGPSHAEEVLAGQPAGLALAGPEPLIREMQRVLNKTPLRVYLSHDLPGVELAGALKNVIAIAAGCVDALDFGDNVKATLVTRGLAEIRRLGRAYGCQDHTFAGLAGIGDLLTTCYSQHGRNRALGSALVRGETLDAFCKRTGTVPEGAWSARAAVELAERLRVELPIASQVNALLSGEKPVAIAINELLSRSAREEDL